VRNSKGTIKDFKKKIIYKCGEVVRRSTNYSATYAKQEVDDVDYHCPTAKVGWRYFSEQRSNVAQPNASVSE